MGIFDSILPSATPSPSPSPSSSSSPTLTPAKPSFDAELDCLFKATVPQVILPLTVAPPLKLAALPKSSLSKRKADDAGDHDQGNKKKPRVSQSSDNPNDSNERRSKRARTPSSSLLDSSLDQDSETARTGLAPTNEASADKDTDSDNDQNNEALSLAASARRDDLEKMGRTIFIGNLPMNTMEKKQTKSLKRLFLEYGPIESIRFRSIAFKKPIPRRVGFITKSFHPEMNELNAYIVFKDQESALKALGGAGALFGEEGAQRHIRVDSCRASTATKRGKPAKRDPEEPKKDTKKTVFVGNLPFTTETEKLWEFFSQAGDVTNVRIIRDRQTQVGKGFAYVAFKDRSSVSLALKLGGQPFQTRSLRITKCISETIMAQRKTEGEHASKDKTIKLNKKKTGAAVPPTESRNASAAKKRKSKKMIKKAVTGMGKMKKTKK